MADPDEDADEVAGEARFPGEAVDDEYVDLRADLIADVEAGAIQVRPSPEGRGPVVSDVVIRGGRFHNVWLEGVRFDGVYLDGGVDWWAWGPNLTPWLEGLTINGVDIAPLLDAELDRRHPERPHLKDVEDLTGLRAAWPHVEAMWAPTIDRARSMPEAMLKERVDGEYSFLETLRHLVFGEDAWLRRAVRHEDRPFHALAKAFPDDSGCWSADGTVPWSAVGVDVDADPSLDEVLAAREENWALVRTTLDELDEDRLASTPEPLQTAGYPPGTEERSVLRCFRTILNEEWWHHRFAVRDLDRLAAAEPGRNGG